MKKAFLFGMLILLWTVTASAQESAVGKWKTVDDVSKKEKSIIEIYETGGKLYGRIVELLLPEDKGKLCDKCTGADLNKPLVGLVIMKGLQKDGSEYSGGTILDPKNGETYRCKMEVQENGKKLRVRGFIGISLLGRNQFWYRVK
jgi:uncharacterized protein (DUF2147 family)